MGLCMLIAYAWGLMAALIWMVGPAGGGGYWKDMALHALAIGFVMTMVIAHVCMIVPSITRRPMPFHPVLKLDLALVQAGLVLRLLGTIQSLTGLWQSGDLVSILGLLSLMASVFLLTVRSEGVLERKRYLRMHGASASSSPSERPLAWSGWLPDRHRKAVMGVSTAVTALILLAFSLIAVGLPGGLASPLGGAQSEANAGAGQKAAATGSGAMVVPTGRTRRVDVRVSGMSFSPSTIRVNAGDRLVVDFSNTGDQRHDLVFASGQGTGVLPHGGHARVDLGVITASTGGWCSLPGHRQMGMVLTITAAGGAARTAGQSWEPVGNAAVPIAAQAKKFAGSVQPFDAGLPALKPAPDGLRSCTLVIRECREPLAPGLTRMVWSYDDGDDPRGGKGDTRPMSPGPVLRGRVGDTFHMTIRNEGSMSHSIDFHAGPALPERMMRPIEPGQSLEYTFKADHAGIWMYHCSSEPMALHIANGMFGAVVVDDGTLPAVDAEYVLTQSELYLGGDGDGADPGKLAAMRPDLMAFNGRPYQYDAHPLTAPAGGRVRLWLLNAGPNLPLSFHLIGAQFDTVWSEGRYLITQPGRTDAQLAAPATGSPASKALALQPAQGGFVEVTIAQPGRYPFTNHIMSLGEQGAHGVLSVR